MPLLAGTVTVTGGVAVGAGLAKELYDALRTDQGAALAPTPVNQQALAQLAKFASTIASVVVNHIKVNALVSTTNTGTVAAGIPVTTAGSAAAQTGATTAPGAVTATGTGTIA